MRAAGKATQQQPHQNAGAAAVEETGHGLDMGASHSLHCSTEAELRAQLAVYMHQVPAFTPLPVLHEALISCMSFPSQIVALNNTHTLS